MSAICYEHERKTGYDFNVVVQLWYIIQQSQYDNFSTSNASKVRHPG